MLKGRKQCRHRAWSCQVVSLAFALRRKMLLEWSVTLQSPGHRRKHLFSIQRYSQFQKCATGLGHVLAPFQETSVQIEMCFSKSISEMSWDAVRMILAARKHVWKGSVLHLSNPLKPRRFAKLRLGIGSVPEMECSELMLCSLGFNFPILVVKCLMFSNHRQTSEQYCK